MSSFTGKTKDGSIVEYTKSAKPVILFAICIPVTVSFKSLNPLTFGVKIDKYLLSEYVPVYILPLKYPPLGKKANSLLPV